MTSINHLWISTIRNKIWNANSIMDIHNLIMEIMVYHTGRIMTRMSVMVSSATSHYKSVLTQIYVVTGHNALTGKWNTTCHSCCIWRKNEEIQNSDVLDYVHGKYKHTYVNLLLLVGNKWSWEHFSMNWVISIAASDGSDRKPVRFKIKVAVWQNIADEIRDTGPVFRNRSVSPQQGGTLVL